MTLSQNYSPYYNDFDTKKGFLEILFKPGSPVQARELTQLQSILQSQISSFASYTFAANSVVSGLGVTTTNTVVYAVDPSVAGNAVDLTKITPASYTTDKSRTVQIYAVDQANLYIYTDNPSMVIGELIPTNIGNIKLLGPTIGNAFVVDVGAGIYFAGDRFVNLPAATLVPVPLGTAITGAIGLEYSTSVVTAATDNSLNDPARGVYGYTNEGADRLVMTSTFRWVTSTSTAPANWISLSSVSAGVWTPNLSTYQLFIKKLLGLPISVAADTKQFDIGVVLDSVTGLPVVKQIPILPDVDTSYYLSSVVTPAPAGVVVGSLFYDDAGSGNLFVYMNDGVNNTWMQLL